MIIEWYDRTGKLLTKTQSDCLPQPGSRNTIISQNMEIDGNWRVVDSRTRIRINPIADPNMVSIQEGLVVMEREPVTVPEE